MCRVNDFGREGSRVRELGWTEKVRMGGMAGAVLTTPSHTLPVGGRGENGQDARVVEGRGEVKEGGREGSVKGRG